MVTGKRAAFSQQLDSFSSWIWGSEAGMHSFTSWLEAWINGQENWALFPAMPSGWPQASQGTSQCYAFLIHEIACFPLKSHLGCCWKTVTRTDELIYIYIFLIVRLNIRKKMKHFWDPAGKGTLDGCDLAQRLGTWFSFPTEVPGAICEALLYLPTSICHSKRE